MRMNRRKVLLGLGTAAAGSSAVFGSGAFSSVQAERTVSVDVVDDNAPDAALQLQPLTNNASVTQIDNGNFEFNFDENGSAKVNRNSKVRFGAEFTVTNNGDQPVLFLIDVSGTTTESAVDSFSFFTAQNAIDDSEFETNSSTGGIPGATSSTFAIDGNPSGGVGQNTGVVLASNGGEFPVAGAIGLADETADFGNATITVYAISDNDEAFPQVGPTYTGRFDDIDNSASVPIFGVPDSETGVDDQEITVDSEGTTNTSSITAIYNGGTSPKLTTGL